jgi:adenylate cyclase class IV
MNHQEIEIKFYVNDLKRLEARLLELGAFLIQPRVHESNVRFDEHQKNGTYRFMNV